MLDKRSNVIAEYKYDVTAEMFIGEAPISKATEFPGEKVSATPNSNGGHNIRCKAGSGICFISGI